MVVRWWWYMWWWSWAIWDVAKEEYFFIVFGLKCHHTLLCAMNSLGRRSWQFEYFPVLVCVRWPTINWCQRCQTTIAGECGGWRLNESGDGYGNCGNNPEVWWVLATGYWRMMAVQGSEDSRQNWNIKHNWCMELIRTFGFCGELTAATTSNGATKSVVFYVECWVFIGRWRQL